MWSEFHAIRGKDFNIFLIYCAVSALSGLQTCRLFGPCTDFVCNRRAENGRNGSKQDTHHIHVVPGLNRHRVAAHAAALGLRQELRAACVLHGARDHVVAAAVALVGAAVLGRERADRHVIDGRELQRAVRGALSARVRSGPAPTSASVSAALLQYEPPCCNRSRTMPLRDFLWMLLFGFLRTFRAAMRLDRMRRVPGKRSGQAIRFVSAPRAHGRTRRKPAWVRREILRMKAFMPDAGVRSLELSFNRRFASRGMRVSKSTIATWLREHRYEVEHLRQAITRRVPRPQVKNACWGLDMTGKADASGAIHMVLGCVDHGTRQCVALDALENKNAWTLLGYLFLAIGRGGKPRAVRTDNEACWTSRVFTTALRLAGIRHQRTAPGCPWMNGRIERFFGTLKQKLDAIRPVSGEALQGLLEEFRLWYNVVRPHQHLAGATPQEAWDGIDPWSAPVKACGPDDAW